MFAGLINLPGMPTSRPPEVQGGFDESTGSVTINLYGNVFTITGWLTGGDSDAAQIDQQGNTGNWNITSAPAGSTTGNQPVAILPGGETVNQGLK